MFADSYVEKSMTDFGERRLDINLVSNWNTYDVTVTSESFDIFVNNWSFSTILLCNCLFCQGDGYI